MLAVFPVATWQCACLLMISFIIKWIITTHSHFRGSLFNHVEGPNQSYPPSNPAHLNCLSFALLLCDNWLVQVSEYQYISDSSGVLYIVTSHSTIFSLYVLYGEQRAWVTSLAAADVMTWLSHHIQQQQHPTVLNQDLVITTSLPTYTWPVRGVSARVYVVSWCRVLSVTPAASAGWMEGRERGAMIKKNEEITGISDYAILHKAIRHGFGPGEEWRTGGPWQNSCIL